MLWTRILIIILMLGSIVLIFRQLSRKIPIFDKVLEVHNQGLISESEIRERIKTLNLDNKSMLEINSQEISKKLKELPIVNEVRIRTLVFPKKTYKVYISEANPWAMYRGGVLDDKTKVLIKSRAEAYSHHSKAINKLYSDFYNNSAENNLIKLESASELDHKTLVLIKEINDLVVSNLELMNNKELVKTDFIHVDRDNNLTIYSANLKIVAGIINKQIKARIKRLDSIIAKIIELGAAKEIEYIDLSLKTSEVILGKRSKEIYIITKPENSQGKPLEQGQTYIPTQSPNPNGLTAVPQGATL